MPISRAVKMMLMQQDRGDKQSEYAGNDGRRMIGYDRNPAKERMRADDYSVRERPHQPMDRYDYPTEMRMPYYPIEPGMRAGNTYGDIYAHGSIYAPGATNKPEAFRDYDSKTHEPLTEHKARKWVDRMSSGEHFPINASDQHRNAFCPDCEKWEFYVVLNAMYADYNKTAKEMNMDKPEFYARLARDFIKDEDASPGKVVKYMETIPKK